MKVSHKSILEALKKVPEPDLGKDIVSLGLVSELKYSKENIFFCSNENAACMLEKGWKMPVLLQ